MPHKSPDFTFIRYANCWEDIDLMLENLALKGGERILSIASAGDNSLALLAHDPGSVLAFDVNETQLFLTELKQKAIKNLSRHHVMELLGFFPSNRRETYFKRLVNDLSEPARSYFEKNKHLIQDGIIHQGKFEKYFWKFRRYVLPLVHARSRIDSLFTTKSDRAQHDFYHRKWNNKRWRLLFRIFFSRYVMGKLGRDPEFFREVKEPVGESILRRAQKHLETTAVFGNFFLDYQLRGKFTVGLPYYLRPENFDRIKHNIDRLELFKGYLTDVPAEPKFDVMNLSNIFEYMNSELFEKQARHITQIAKGSAKVAYWNLLVERKLPMAHPAFSQQEVHGRDKCFFYGSFNLDVVNS